MAYNKEQFRELISYVLAKYNMYSEDAVELLMLTAAVESNLGTYIKQVGGPAVGVFQMEPNTHNDIWNNYLVYKFRSLNLNTQRENPHRMMTDLEYAILMARIHYLRVSERLPDRSSPEELGKYWKKYYNTSKGKGTVEKAVAKYNKYCV